MEIRRNIFASTSGLKVGQAARLLVRKFPQKGRTVANRDYCNFENVSRGINSGVSACTALYIETSHSILRGFLPIFLRLGMICHSSVTEPL
jgi:hypothetical protein